MRVEFHHIGLACRSIAAEQQTMADLDMAAEGPAVEDPIQKVRVQFFSGPGPRIELIEPMGPGSPIDDLIRRGTKLYHLAYATDDFDSYCAQMERKGFRAVSEPAPAVAFGMNRIVFMISPTLTLIEAIEQP